MFGFWRGGVAPRRAVPREAIQLADDKPSPFAGHFKPQSGTLDNSHCSPLTQIDRPPLIGNSRTHSNLPQIMVLKTVNEHVPIGVDF